MMEIEFIRKKNVRGFVTFRDAMILVIVQKEKSHLNSDRVSRRDIKTWSFVAHDQDYVIEEHLKEQLAEKIQEAKTLVVNIISTEEGLQGLFRDLFSQYRDLNDGKRLQEIET